MSDYYKGLWYFDISLASATTSLSVIIRIGDSSGAYGWGNNNQTGTILLGAFGGEDTIWLNNGVYWDSGENRNSRNSSTGTTNGFSAVQLHYVFTNGGFDTCSSANTNGYNSYPQMKKNFFDKTTVDLTGEIVSGSYSVQDYIDGMKARSGN